MIRWVAVSLIALPLTATLLVLLLRLFVPASEVSQIHRPVGYVQAMELFIQKNWLRYEDQPCATEDCETKPQIVENYKDLPIEAEDRKAIQSFVDESFIRADLEAFNTQSDYARFRIQNGRLQGVDPNAHNFVLPLSGAARWTGTLTYRPPSARSGLLVGDGFRIALLPPTQRLDKADDFEIVDLGRPNDSLEKAGEKVRLTKGLQTLAEFRLVGDHMVIESRATEGFSTVKVSGYKLEAGEHFRLDEGDVVRIAWVRRLPGGVEVEDTRLFWVKMSNTAAVISSHRNVNGRKQRHPQSPSPTIAAEIISALDAAALSQSEGQSYAYDRGELDSRWQKHVPLTLDFDMQSLTQDYLEAFVDNLRKQRAKGDRLEEPKRAAVTIMDATTGELLVLASYPTPSDGFEEQPLNPSLFANHNFVARPMGSVVKPLFAASIIAERPELVDLKLAGGGAMRAPIDSVFGMELRPVLSTENSTSMSLKCVTFDDFIKYSSNKYAFALMVLAGERDTANTRGKPISKNAKNRCPNEKKSYTIGSRRYEIDLENMAFKTLGQDVKHGEIETLKFVSRLQEMFSISVHNPTGSAQDGRRSSSRPGWAGDDRTDTSVWRELLTEIHEGPRKVPSDHGFFAASPARTSLKFNLIQNIRTEYLTQIIGGAESRWSPVKVAESFARIVSGCMVEARLYWHEDIVPCSDQLARDDERLTGDQKRWRFPMPDAPRQRLMNALTLPTTGGGTAGGLSTVLRQLSEGLKEQNKVLGVFSKTGTPQLFSRRYTRTAAALNSLIRDEALKFNTGDKRIHYREIGAVILRDSSGQLNEPLISALLDHPSDWARAVEAAGGRTPLDPETLLKRVDLFNRADREQRERIFSVSRDGVLEEALDTDDEKEFGGVFAAYLGAYDRRALVKGTGKEAREYISSSAVNDAGYVISVMMENAESSRDAVRFTEKLITNIIAPKLMANGEDR